MLFRSISSTPTASTIMILSVLLRPPATDLVSWWVRLQLLRTLSPQSSAKLALHGRELSLATWRRWSCVIGMIIFFSLLVGTDIASTCTAATPSPYAKSDDGIEGVLEVDSYKKTASSRTSLCSEEKEDGRGVVKSGFGDDCEFMEVEDQCDNETEEFQQESLADPLAENGCHEVVGQGGKPGTTNFGFGEEERSQRQTDGKEEDERLFLEAKWISHEGARTERGGKTRALDTIINEGGFLPSVTFMRADMEGENRARRADHEEEKPKYVSQIEEEERATYVEDIPADILVEYVKRDMRGEVREEVTSGEDHTTASRENNTHEIEAKAEVIPSEAPPSEYEVQM